jgi:hypothetical protein
MPKKSKKNYNKNKNINKNNIKININTGSKKRRTTNSAPVPRHAQPIIINNGSNNNQHELMHLLNNFKKDLDESNRVKTNNFVNPNKPTPAIIQTSSPHTSAYSTPETTPFTTPRGIQNIIPRNGMEGYINHLIAQPRVQPRLTPQPTPQATPRFVTPREETPRFVTPRETPQTTPRNIATPQSAPINLPPRPSSIFTTMQSPHQSVHSTPNATPNATPRHTTPRTRPEIPRLPLENLLNAPESPIMTSQVPHNIDDIDDMQNPEDDIMERDKDFRVSNESVDLNNLSHSSISSKPSNYFDEPDSDEDEDPNREKKLDALHNLGANRMKNKLKRKEERKGFRHHYQPLMNKLDEYIQVSNKKLTKDQLSEINALIDDPTQKIKFTKKPSTIRDEYNDLLNRLSPPQTMRQQNQSTRVLRSHTYNNKDKMGPG